MSKIFELNKNINFVLVRYHYDYGRFHYDVFSEHNNFIYLIQAAYCEYMFNKINYHIAIIEADGLEYLEGLGPSFADPNYYVEEEIQKAIESSDITEWLKDFKKEKLNDYDRI